MADEILKELESAAHVLLSPPNVVTSEQRHAAEAVFINFRKMFSPFNLCKHILETSKVDYVLFEAAGLIKEAGIREWPYMHSSDITALRDYLLRYVIERPTLAPFVREKLLQVIAIMIKRGSVEDYGKDQQKLVQEVKQLISNGSLPQQLVGCGIIAAMIQEFEISSKSADIGLAWDTHIFAKNHFEGSTMKDIFTFTTRALRELVKNDSPPQQLVKQLVSIAASVLCWNHRISVFELSNSATCPLTSRPPTGWKDVLINLDTLHTYFEVYWKVRNDPSLAHHAMTCLTQMASFQGPIWDEIDEPERTAFFSVIIQSFCTLSNRVLDREALGVATILHGIVAKIETLPPDLINSYLDHLTNYTCLFGEGAAEEESMCVENTYYMEAFTRLLTAWLKVFNTFHSSLHDPPSKEFRRNACTAAVKVIETYLQCHLSPPIGVRGLGREIEAEEIDELEEDDREKFSDQLECIGFLARQVPEHVLPLLARLIEDCTGRIFSQLQRMSTHAVQISDHRIMENLSEDIHWLVLMAGHALTMDATGETPLIPNEVMQYSIKQFDSVDIDTSLKVITSPEQYIQNIQGADESCDYVIRLVAAVFRLCDLERRAFEAKLENFMSPQVGCSIMWFLQRWAKSYLLPDENYYTHMSAPIMTAFGKDTEVAAWVTNFLLNKIESNLKHTASEPHLLQDTVHLLIAMVMRSDRASYVLKTSGFVGIINLQEICTSDAFPQEAKRGYYEALGKACDAFRESEESLNFIQKIVEPILSKFKSVIGLENFVRNFHEAQTKNSIVNCFDAFIGLTRGSAGSRSSISNLPMFLNPIISELPSLVGLYNNYPEMVEIIFELLNETAKHMILYLSSENTKILSMASLQTMQTFANCNSNRLNLHSTSEDDTFKDIQLILDLLSNLLSKDFCDFSFDNEESPQKTSDIVITGLYVVMPLLSADLLKCPVLCIKFYQTLAYVCDLSTEKVATLPEDLLKQLLSAIEMGLRVLVPEVLQSCLSFLRNLVRVIPERNGEKHPLYSYLRPFFHIVFDLAVLNRVSGSNLWMESQTVLTSLLFTFICRFKVEYVEAVRSLVNSQANPAVAERLESAFERLSEASLRGDVGFRDPTSVLSRELSFSTAFLKFLPIVQGMFIK